MCTKTLVEVIVCVRDWCGTCRTHNTIELDPVPDAFTKDMENIFSIGAGVALRVVLDVATGKDHKLIGLSPAVFVFFFFQVYLIIFTARHTYRTLGRRRALALPLKAYPFSISIAVKRPISRPCYAHGNRHLPIILNFSLCPHMCMDVGRAPSCRRRSQNMARYWTEECLQGTEEGGEGCNEGDTAMEGQE